MVLAVLESKLKVEDGRAWTGDQELGIEAPRWPAIHRPGSDQVGVKVVNNLGIFIGRCLSNLSYVAAAAAAAVPVWLPRGICWPSKKMGERFLHLGGHGQGYKEKEQGWPGVGRKLGRLKGIQQEQEKEQVEAQVRKLRSWWKVLSRRRGKTGRKESLLVRLLSLRAPPPPQVFGRTKFLPLALDWTQHRCLAAAAGAAGAAAAAAAGGNPGWPAGKAGWSAPRCSSPGRRRKVQVPLVGTTAWVCRGGRWKVSTGKSMCKMLDNCLGCLRWQLGLLVILHQVKQLQQGCIGFLVIYTTFLIFWGSKDPQILRI